MADADNELRIRALMQEYGEAINAGNPERVSQIIAELKELGMHMYAVKISDKDRDQLLELNKIQNNVALPSSVREKAREEAKATLQKYSSKNRKGTSTNG